VQVDIIDAKLKFAVNGITENIIIRRRRVNEPFAISRSEVSNNIADTRGAYPVVRLRIDYHVIAGTKQGGKYLFLNRSFGIIMT